MSLEKPSASYKPEDVAKAQKITTWLDELESRSSAELCRLANVAPATISQILNGKYVSSPSSFLDKLQDAINRQTERTASRNQIPFTPTSISKSLEMVCKRAHSDCDFGYFSGSVGIGKTQALRQYMKKTASAILVEAFEGIDNRTFITEMITASGQAPVKGTVSQQTSVLIRALKGSDRVILVDEANHLPAKSLGALRRISDVAEIGVILVGTQELLQMVQDPAGRFGQISSRIGYWPPAVKTISRNDSNVLVTAYFEESLGDKILDAFWECCEGSARTLRNLLRNTYRIAATKKTKITAKLIAEVNTNTMAGRGFTTRRTS